MSFGHKQRVYDVSGFEYEYVAAVPGGHLVLPVNWESDEKEEKEVLGRPEVLSDVFAIAPRKKCDEVIAALDREIAQLEKRKRALTAEQTAELAAHEKLAHIADFLAGKPLWFVLANDYHAEVRSTQERTTTALRLRRYGEDRVRWEFGDSADIRDICQAKEEAEEKLRECIAGYVRDHLADLPHISDQCLRWVDLAQKHGVLVDDRMLAAVTARRQKEHARAIADAEKAAQAAQQKLAALRGAA